MFYQSLECVLCRHPFDSSKWGRICRFLISDGVLEKLCVVEPLEASKEDLLVVLATVFSCFSKLANVYITSLDIFVERLVAYVTVLCHT